MQGPGRAGDYPAIVALLLLNLGVAGSAICGELLPSARSRISPEILERPSDLPTDAQLEAEGARVGRVHIIARQIFDTDRPEDDTRLFRLANRLHIRTREDTIASQLLFRSGDRYVGRLLEESERMLRTARYLYDARVRPVAYRGGVVDVEVRTRDVWTFNPGISFGRSGGENTSGFELEELNILGTGARLSLGHRSDVDRDSDSLAFEDRQLFGSWWGAALRYADNSDGESRALNIERPFYALDTRWAAGLSAADDRGVVSRYDLGEIADQYQAQVRQATVFAGWSNGLVGDWTRRWSFGLTYDDRKFDALPSPSIRGLVPSDRRLLYPWIGLELIEDRYFTDRNRDLIERTEDIELGLRARMQLGYSAAGLGATRDAWIVSAAATRGFDAGERRTMLLAATLAGRIEDGGIVNGSASAALRWYRRLAPRRLLFLSLSADVTDNADDDTQLLLGGDSGLRGYPLRYQGGEGRWLLTAEQRFYSTWYPFRLVHVGGAVFFDAGRTFGKNRFGSGSAGLLKDVGFGLRLGNSRSGQGNVVHVDIAFPLDGGAGIDDVQMLLETKRRF